MQILPAVVVGAKAAFAASAPSTSPSPLKRNATAALQGWTPESSGRGTWTLLWTCLSTIFVCLWVAVHLNIPAATDGNAKKHWRRFMWLVIGAFAPEWVSWMAVDQWMAARYTIKKIRELGHDWTNAQAFYLNMGGFVFKTRDGAVRTLDSPRFRWLIEHKHIEWPEPDKRPPAWYVTDGDIKDKSKADGLVKLVALLQVLWLVFQCIARAANRLPLSTLEITTVAYVACMLFSYAYWWNKPYDVAVATTIDLSHLSDAKLDEMRALVPGESDFVARTPNMFGTETRDDGWSSLIIGLLTIAFGAIHLAAWDFIFPTQAERVAWQVCACITTGMPILLVVVQASMSPFNLPENISDAITLASSWFFVILYLLSRTFLIVEIFLALRAQPPGVYETWVFVNYFFHLL
ncbi:MAG: hypothetical protein M1840_007056 [Geoglossum simile]|nr:MAG: hypothetical protein M1840_007056 [Geoglossum simile]